MTTNHYSTRSYPRCTGRDNHPRKRGSMNYTNRSSSVMNVNSLKQRCRLKELSYGDLLQRANRGGSKHPEHSLAPKQKCTQVHISPNTTKTQNHTEWSAPPPPSGQGSKPTKPNTDTTSNTCMPLGQPRHSPSYLLITCAHS